MNWTRTRRAIALAVLTVAQPAGYLAGAAWAQEPALDPVHGRDVAQRVCVGCHAIEPGVQQRQADVPSFPEIANRPGRTIQTIIGAMYYPHPEMPGVPLTTKETRDVAAYILTFRKAQ
ncbi:MAG TPA: cytochrome c [Hyphomicrobiaceae bacterium]|jgi:mono/diheme cytochrome c family protein